MKRPSTAAFSSAPKIRSASTTRRKALRILGDSVAFGTRAEAYLRQALTKAGVDVPIKVDLEIMKYVDQRGSKKLPFDPKLEIKDPYGLQERFF